MLLSSRVPPKFIVGIYGTSVLCQLSTERPSSEKSKKKNTTIKGDPPGRLALTHIPIRIHKDHERLNAHSVDSAEDDYVEVPILLQKMANSASSTQCTNNR